LISSFIVFSLVRKKEAAPLVRAGPAAYHGFESFSDKRNRPAFRKREKKKALKKEVRVHAICVLLRNIISLLRFGIKGVKKAKYDRREDKVFSSPCTTLVKYAIIYGVA